MSTITKLCVVSDEERVQSELKCFLGLAKKEFKISKSEWSVITRESFELDSVEPSIYSIKQITPDVTEIYFNCFGHVKDLASTVSKNIATSVVVLHYQSVSEACYWAYYVNGECLRELMQGDGELHVQNGKPLPFENNPPGINLADDDEEPYYLFDERSMDEYNLKVGIPVETYQESDSGWVNYEITNLEPDKSAYEYKEISIKKPWWKLW